MPAGFAKTAPASPTSAAPAPPRPAARVDAGRLTHAPAPDWAARDDTKKTLQRSVARKRPETSSATATSPRDVVSRRLFVTPLRDVVPFYCIRMTFSRGTSEPRNAPPAVLLNNRPNCAAPAACRARKDS